ncbi:MAG: hypothetical protein ACOVKO_03695 [Elstera sp.]
MGRYSGSGNEPEILIDPGRGPGHGSYRRQSPGGFGQIVRIVLAFCALAAVIGGALLLVASVFTVLALAVPVILIAGLVYVLINRRKLRTITIRRG